MNTIYNDDVVEYTLNNGVGNSAQFFGITRDEVKAIVKPFTDDFDNMIRSQCDCLSGKSIFCFAPCQYQNHQFRIK